MTGVIVSGTPVSPDDVFSRAGVARRIAHNLGDGPIACMIGETQAHLIYGGPAAAYVRRMDALVKRAMAAPACAGRKGLKSSASYLPFIAGAHQ